MSGETLITVDNVSKKFCRSLKRSMWYGLLDLGNEIRGRRHDGKGSLRPSEFWAVNDVSFELKRGDCLGLIGRNGAGKTTLLRMLNGLIKPDTGRVEIRGRVGGLIALGAGFNPVLTGRENIYVNASVLGLSKREIQEKVDSIIDFSEIDDFIDAPVQTYSSGMQVRLGFSIASTLNPDILLLDEVLAVGDRQFRQKCLDRVATNLKSSAVVFVSHQLDHLSRICNVGMHLKNGTSEKVEDIQSALLSYDSELAKQQKGSLVRKSQKIEDFDISFDTCIVSWRSDLNLYLTVKTNAAIACGSLQVFFRQSSDQIAAEWNSKNHSNTASLLKLRQGRNELNISIETIQLVAGTYGLTINLYDRDDTYLFSSVNVHKIYVRDCAYSVATYQL